MKKKLFIVLICTLGLLTACNGKEEAASQPLPTATLAPNIIESVPVENAVTTFEEDKFEFGPATLKCELPKGFNETEYPGEYLYKTYPKDVSSINHVIIESDENTTNQTKEEFIEALKADFLDAYGFDLDFEVTQFDKIMVEGRPGLWVMYNYNFRGDEYCALNVILFNGHETSYLTYLQGPGADWMDKFVESAKTLTYRE